MHEDVKRLKELCEAAEDHLTKTMEVSADLLAKLQSGEYSMEEMVDIGFFWRDMSNFLDEARKECNARKELFGKTIALKVTQENINSTTIPTVHGLFASGTPDVKVSPILPKARSDRPEVVAAYRELCDFMGIDPEARDKGLVTFHFRNVEDWLTELAAQGKNPPKGILNTFPSYQTIFRRKK